MGASIHLLPAAESDIDETLIHYGREGGSALALRWTDEVEAALRHIALHPASGSPRYMDMLGLYGLRFWPVRHFPYLVFYVERTRQVDVWRVLHAERDLPAWLRAEDF